MIKKMNKLFVILVFLLFIPYNNVFADEIIFDEFVDKFEEDERHIVLIDNLRVTGSKLNISGYAFISHVDNYGWDGNKGNLKTYIVAYKADNDAEDTDDWDDDYAVYSLCNSESNKNSCYSKKTNLNTESDLNDMFYTRCIGEGCSKNRALSVTSNSTYSTGACHGNYNCMYYNVAFKVDIDLKDIVNRFFGSDGFNSEIDGKKIKFKIVSYVNEGIKFSNLGLYSGVCKVESDISNCLNNGGEFITGNNEYNIKLTGINSLFRYDAGLTRAKKDKNTNDDKLELVDALTASGANYYFRKNRTYTILDMTDEPIEFAKTFKNSSGNWQTEYYSDYFIKLDSKSSGSEQGGRPGSRVLEPDDNGGSSGLDYWALASWGTFNNSLEISKFGIILREVECTDIDEVYQDASDTEGTEGTIDCSANDYEADFYQCRNVGKKKGTMYYRIGDYVSSDYDVENLSCSGLNKASVQRIDVGRGAGNYGIFIPVTVYADVLIEQTGTFSFSKLSSSRVFAGKSFNFIDDVIYENEVRWFVAKKRINSVNLKYNNMPYFYYEATLYEDVDGNGCVIDDNFNINDIVYEKLFTNEQRFYYRRSDKKLGSGGGLAASIGAINIDLREDYFLSYNNVLEEDEDGNLTLNKLTKIDDVILGKDREKVTISSCDSNESSIDCEVVDDIGGTWDVVYDDDKDGKARYVHLDNDNNQSVIASPIKYEDDSKSTIISRAFGVRRKSTYTYSLPYAYVVLSDINGYDAGDILYSDTEITDSDLLESLYYAGNKYFVSMQYVFNNNLSNRYDFPFNLAESNPSLVSVMDWNLSGICGVDVEDGYYEKTPGVGGDLSGENLSLKYKYRSISVTNPFPKNNVPVNWTKWYETNTDLDRIKSSYENVKYSITFTKNNSSLSVSSINNCNNVEKCSKFYGDLTHINAKAETKFVSEYFDDIKQNYSDKSYCGLGFFSTKCDMY